MTDLTRDDLMSLEQYAEARAEFRTRVMAHKRNRKVAVGAHVTLYFEDKLTMQYQIQEMLRIERVFEAAGIQEELDAYNPLIPDGTNWKATFMVEYSDVDERREALERLRGIEDKVWARVQGFDPVFAIADEDLERSDETKTSSVHFLRFELTEGMIKAATGGAGISFGIDHPEYSYQAEAVDGVREALVADLSQ